jgi:hypothetical protein
MLYTEYSFHQKSQIVLERDYTLVLSREQKRNNLQHSGRESMRLERKSKKDSIVNRDFHPTTLLLLQTHINFPRFLPIFPDFLERLSHLAPIY